MIEINEDVDIQPLLDLVNSPELLDEGIISAIKGKILSLAISILPEKSVNAIINKSFTKAMGKAKTPEEKQKLIDLRKEMLSLDKKAKKAKLKEFIKKAPEKDRAAAELKLRNELKKKNKNIKESVIYEDGEQTFDPADYNKDGVVDISDVEGINNARRAQSAGLTIGDVEDKNVAVAAEKAELQSSLSNWRLHAIILGVVCALLTAALIASVVKNIQLA